MRMSVCATNRDTEHAAVKKGLNARDQISIKGRATGEQRDVNAAIVCR